MGASVRVLMLGRFELGVGGVTIGPDDFERRSGAELVQLLALTPGHRLHREQVMAALWPGAEPGSAANSLRKAATFARQATGADDAIVVRDQVVSLFPDRPVETDVEVVETARADDEESVVAAVDAYRGELLPDAPYAEWAARARDGIRRRLMALMAATHRWDDLLALDPANEEAMVAVMDRALAAGDRQAVLRLYDELEARLRDELGVTPGPAAVVLRDRARHLGGTSSTGARGTKTFLLSDADPAGGLVDEVVQARGGIVFQHPDWGLGAVFDSASAAVEAAVAIQRAAGAAGAAGDGGRPPVRVGLDVGEAEHHDGAWSGVVLDRAAYLLDAANGGQIVCSDLVATLAAPGLAADVTTVDLGLYRLPDQAPSVLHRVDAEGVERRTGLRAARLSGRPAVPPRDLLIGRQDELADVRRLLIDEHLVTVVGPGGAGKTHLARHVAGAAVEEFPGGAWLCRFGAVDAVGSVPQELLSTIGAVQHPDATVTESIIRSLGQRRTLIVFDNCEHLLESIAPLSRQILDRCPGVTLLATSREPLGLEEERQYPLGQLSRRAAIELFVTGARRQGVELDPADVGVARICDRLDDLPLAVQLAAARTRTLDLATIEALLDDRFAFLSSSSVDRPDHHQTLGAAMAWSFDGLSPELHHLLCRLSVLTGRFTLDEACAVAGGSGVPAAAVVDGLDVLVRRSLVVGPEQAEGPGGGETVYRLLESIRLFARHRSDPGPALDRHLAHFCAAAEEHCRRQEEDSLSALGWFRSRWSDLRQAQAHAVASDRLDDLCRIVNAVISYCRNTGQLEIVEWCERGLDPEPPTVRGPHHARALANWASLCVHRGQVEQAKVLVASASGAGLGLVETLLAEMLISWSKGDHPHTARLVDRILQATALEPSVEAGVLMFKAIFVSGTGGDVAPVAHRLHALAAGRGPVFEAQDLFVDALTQVGADPAGAATRLDECQFLTDRHELMDIGAAVRLVRSWVVPALADGPLDLLDEMASHIEWLRERGLWSYALVQLSGSAPALAQVDRPDLAVTLLSACAANGFTPSFRADVIDTLLDEAETADPAGYAGWWEAGQRLDPSSACLVALEGIEQLRPSPGGRE